MTNAVGAKITGATIGIYIKSGPGTVTNAGAITGTSFDGIRTLGGLTLQNLASGVIAGGQAGVYVLGEGDITNAGRITGASFNSGIGLASGTVTNLAGGVISGGDAVGGGNVSVTNAGTILGSSTSIFIGGAGSVTNEAGEVIEGGTAVGSYGAPITVTNSGLIVGTANTSTNGQGVRLDQGGTVVNNATGVITSSASAAVYVYRGSGANTVTNFGKITSSAGEGVRVEGPASVTNAAGASISGETGVSMNGSPSQLTNAGTIVGTELVGVGSEGAGVVTFGGTITNATTGSISGARYGLVLVGLTSTTLTNAGTISGTSLDGVNASDPGDTMTNAATGVITGGFAGIYVSQAVPATLTNAGQVQGGQFGVQFRGAGTVVNQAGGLIAGAALDGIDAMAVLTLQNQAGASITGGRYGVQVAGGSVTNAGTITGGVDSVKFIGAGSNTLTLQTGSLLNGAAVGSTAEGATSALILRGTGVANNDFVNFNTLVDQGPGPWTLGGTSAIGTTEVAAGSLIVTGALTSTFTIDAGATLQGGSGSLLAQGTVTDNGTLLFDQAKRGTFANAIDGTGAIVKQNAGALTLSGTSAVASTDVAAGTLIVTGPLTSAFQVDKGATLQGSTTTLLAQGTVADNGALVFDQAAAGTFANAIDGTGAIVKRTPARSR